MGWLPDRPDIRDYTPAHPVIRRLAPTGVGAFPPSIDLRQYCSPIEDQGTLGSCTANAGVGLYEYMQRRATGKHLDLSRLFLYKVTRDLMRVTGDTGAFLRTTMGAMALFGAPPEEYCPYSVAAFDKEPSAFLYSFAQSFQALRYFRLDPPMATLPEVQERIKSYLFRGYAVMYGFTVYSSIWDAPGGEIPYPGAGEIVEGGHAIVIVGYDDTKTIKGSGAHSPTTTGAYRIRNSWGTGWGDQGYGWMPYEYVLTGLADDFWAMTKAEWVETGQFKE